MFKNFNIWQLISAILLLATLVLLYFQINNGVTMTYQNDAKILLKKKNDLLQQMLTYQLVGSTKEQVTELIKKNFSEGHLIKEGDPNPDSLSVDDLVFTFEGGKLKAINGN